MSRLSPTRTMLIGVAIILAVNAIALGGVAYNRSGKPESVLQLSQRELHEPAAWQRKTDSSGITLHIQWRVPVRITDADDKAWQQLSYQRYAREPDWLDADKLAALGFDTRPPLPATDDTDNYDREPRREVFLVLELDGPAYRQSLAQARRVTAATKSDQAQAALLREEQQSSRLFAVDAGRDADALRAKYPDRAHYAIVRATIRPQWSRDKEVSTLSASIEELSVEAINVPRALQYVFQNAAGEVVYPIDDAKRAPFAAVVAFGKRQEPWLIRASKGGGDARQ
jgi:hypothetical protein